MEENPEEKFSESSSNQATVVLTTRSNCPARAPAHELTPDSSTLLESHDHYLQSHDHRTPPHTSSDDHIPQLEMKSYDPRSPITESHDPDTENALSKLYQDDSIGDTVFSKAWVLSILVEILENVEAVVNEANPSGEEGRVNGSEEENCLTEEGGAGGVVELEEGLEERVCILWDASMNVAVAEYIHEQGGISLLLGAACRSNKPRLTEICLGIVGNILCSKEICLNGFDTEEHRSMVLQFLQESDSGVLCQVTRLIQTCLSHEELLPQWLTLIKESEFVKEVFVFILQGSTNDSLLVSTSSLLDLLLNTSEELVRKWADEPLVRALCEAAQQCRDSNFEASCTLITAMHTLTSEQEGVACVSISTVSCAEEASTAVCDFLSTIEELDNHTSCLTALTAACSLYLTLKNAHKGQSYDSNIRKTLQKIKKKLSGPLRTKQLVSLVTRILDS